jgi:hypothetical protein
VNFLIFKMRKFPENTYRRGSSTVVIEDCTWSVDETLEFEATFCSSEGWILVVKRLDSDGNLAVFCDIPLTWWQRWRLGLSVMHCIHHKKCKEAYDSIGRDV